MIVQPSDPSIRYITLTRNMVAVVDSADYPELAAFNWQAIFNKGKWYAARLQWENGKCKRPKMHQQIMGINSDHIDGDGLNNRRSNLRPATQQQNTRNRSKSATNTSGFKGVCRTPQEGKWRARIAVNCSTKFIGLFDSPEEAARAYDAAAIQLHGEFAKLNFPQKAA